MMRAALTVLAALAAVSQARELECEVCRKVSTVVESVLVRNATATSTFNEVATALCEHMPEELVETVRSARARPGHGAAAPAAGSGPAVRTRSPAAAPRDAAPPPVHQLGVQPQPRRVPVHDPGGRLPHAVQRPDGGAMQGALGALQRRGHLPRHAPQRAFVCGLQVRHLWAAAVRQRHVHAHGAVHRHRHLPLPLQPQRHGADGARPPPAAPCACCGHADRARAAPPLPSAASS